MRTILMIANEIQAALSAVATRIDEVWNYVQAQGSAEDAHLAAIEATQRFTEQSALVPGRLEATFEVDSTHFEAWPPAVPVIPITTFWNPVGKVQVYIPQGGSLELAWLPKHV